MALFCSVYFMLLLVFNVVVVVVDDDDDDDAATLMVALKNVCGCLYVVVTFLKQNMCHSNLNKLKIFLFINPVLLFPSSLFFPFFWEVILKPLLFNFSLYVLWCVYVWVRVNVCMCHLMHMIWCVCIILAFFLLYLYLYASVLWFYVFKSTIISCSKWKHQHEKFSPVMKDMWKLLKKSWEKISKTHLNDHYTNWLLLILESKDIIKKHFIKDIFCGSLFIWCWEFCCIPLIKFCIRD